jgi:hypothetical protein
MILLMNGAKAEKYSFISEFSKKKYIFIDPLLVEKKEMKVS